MTPTASAKIASKSKKRPYLLLGILVGAGLVLGGLIAYTISTRPAPFVQPPTPTYVPTPVTNTNTDVPITTTTTNAQLSSGDVSWIPAQKIASLQVFHPLRQGEEYNYSSEASAEYYSVGTIKNGPYSGGQIVIVTFPAGLGSTQIDHLIKTEDSIILLAPRDNQYLSETYDATKIIVDSQTTLPDLLPPPTITGPKSRQVLELLPYSVSLFNSQDLRLVFNDATAGPVYTDATIARIAPPTDALPRSIQPAGGGFLIRMPDGTSYTYKLKIDFISDQNIPAITWDDGSKSIAPYSTTDRGGCGNLNYTAVISPADISITKDLIKVGVNSSDDPIYTLKDTNHKLLKYVYDTSYQVYGDGQKKVSYDEFIKARPLLFWVDPFDRLIKLSNMAFQPMAECGKPVIYLYPPKTTNVSVQVKPEGGLSYSDPVYNNGWQVTAQPSGELTNLTNGQTYPYLFWEGRGGLYQKPNQGWVIARSEVESFLRQQLKSQGLIDKEINDFLEFWLPRMQAKPYYFISFYGTRMMDQLAPLTIEPKPDTIIRLLMDFTPLDQPISVKPYTLPKPPARQGFTVIEWGGVIQ